MEKPPPLLGQQPPLPDPNQSIVSFSLREEKSWEQMLALVLVLPYAKETNTLPMVEVLECQGTSHTHPP